MVAFKSNPANCTVDLAGLATLDSEYEYTAIPILDVSQVLSDRSTPICAQLTYAGARQALGRLGLEMLSAEDVERLHMMATRGEAIELPAFTATPTAETSLEHRRRSDEANRAALVGLGWRIGMPIANFGKGWIRGAPPGRAWLMGWWVSRIEHYGSSGRGPGFIQPRPAPGSRGAHGETDHCDDGTNTWGKRRLKWGLKVPPPLPQMKPSITPRTTIRLGSKGPHVAAWQLIVGVNSDGAFGPKTEAATMRWQAAHELAADGIVGARSWAEAGETFAQPVVRNDSPACLAALRDANAAWPARSHRSDGIPGDAKHQASKSDHNAGEAVDITHDPLNGCNGDHIAAQAMGDARVKYVIWDRQIWNPSISPSWRPYKGDNPHTHHIHISVLQALREDSSPWPWAPG